ncbi:MAG: DUF2490 domain-containing protein [Cryomorphaceae bacterium]|nr:DUF2490 domain-containing protein [Flavobacteriales bacterium]
MRFTLLGILVLTAVVAAAQTRTYSGFFPEAQLTYSPTKKLKLVAKVESQHGLISQENGENAWEYYLDRTDFQGFAGTSINPFTSVAVGYQYRWDGDGENSHRSIQQIGFVQPKIGLRIGHRIRTDQTFLPTASPEFRVRYRIAFDIPLEGQKVDDGEYYFVASNEAIFGTQSGELKIENRLVGSLGYYFGKKQKLEAGIDYRTDDFLDGGLRQRIWLKAGWYVNI